MNPFLPSNLSTHSLHSSKNPNSAYLKLLIPPNAQFEPRTFLSPIKPTFNIGASAPSDSHSTRRDVFKRSSDIRLPTILDPRQRSPPNHGSKNSPFFSYSDSPTLPRKTSPDRPNEMPFGLVTLDKKVFVPEGLMHGGFNGSDHYYSLGNPNKLLSNPNADALDIFVNRDGLKSPKKTTKDSDDEKDDKETKKSRKKKSKSPKEKKRRKSKRAATLDESQNHVRVNKNMLETVIQTALLGTRINEQRLANLERELQRFDPTSRDGKDGRLRTPIKIRKPEFEPMGKPNHLLPLQRDIFTPQKPSSRGSLADFFDKTKPKYEGYFKPSSRLHERLRGPKVNSYENSINPEIRASGKHLTFADEYPSLYAYPHRNYDSFGPRDRLNIPIKTETAEEGGAYDPYQQDMYYNRRQYYQNPQLHEKSYDNHDDQYQSSLNDEEHKTYKKQLHSLQDYFARNRGAEHNEKQQSPHFDDNHQENPEVVNISTLKDEEEEEKDLMNATQIKKSTLKANRRFGVDEAERAKRMKALRIVLWGMAYQRLLSNSLRDFLRKKNKTFQDWFPRTSFANAGMFQGFLAKHLPTPFLNLFKEKKNLQIVDFQGTLKELDQKCKLISEHINNIFTQLQKNLKKEWLPSSFFIFLGAFVQDRSFLPGDYLTSFEIDRFHITRYATLEKMTPDTSKMLIGCYAIIRVMLCRVLTKPWLTFHQFHQDEIDPTNAHVVASVIYQAFMEVFFQKNPIVADNQIHLAKNEKIHPVKQRTRALDSKKLPAGTDEDEFEGIVEGFFNKESLKSFIKDRPALYAKVIAWVHTILDCCYENTKKHFRASSLDTKKYYMKIEN